MKRLLLLIGILPSIGYASEGVRIDWPSTLNVSGTVAVANLPMNPASSAALSATVAISTTPVQIVLWNPNRRGLFLYNPSTTSLYIAYDSTVSYLNHLTFVVPAATTWTMPQPIYLGAIAAVRAVTGDGKILITEMQ